VESGLPKSNDSDRDYHKVTRQLHPDDKCPSGSSSDPSVIPEGKTGTVHLDDKGVHPPRLKDPITSKKRTQNRVKPTEPAAAFAAIDSAHSTYCAAPC
jgi:hypothetical protein